MGTLGAIGAAAQSAAANGATSTAGSVPSLAGDFNTFLTLLTTQLKHQDPTNPVDSNQFTQQLVQFAGVQQQSQTNTLLKQLIAVSQGNQVSSASSFIGTTIQAPGNKGALVNGLGQFGYTLSSTAATANVTITDSLGNTVFSGTGSKLAGSNIVKWSGQNSFTGAQEPDGVYSIKVSATDANGASITATPFTTGTVSSASIDNGAVMLNIGALAIPEGSVTSVTNLPGVPQQTASTGQ